MLVLVAVSIDITAATFSACFNDRFRFNMVNASPLVGTVLVIVL
jgi:hypothetical protein